MTAWRSKFARLILAAGMLLLALDCCGTPPPTENELKQVIDREGYDRLLDWFEREGEATGEIRSVSQSNYYLDFLDEENGRLPLKRRKGVNVRLRMKENAAIFTVKDGEPIDVESLALLGLKTLLQQAVVERPEYQCLLVGGVQTASSILEGMLSLLSEDVKFKECTDPPPSSVLKGILEGGLVSARGDTVFPQSKQLVEVGRNETLRLKIPVNLGGVAVVLELDRTRFPKGFVAYEIEVEIERPEDQHRIEDGLTELLHRLNIRGIPSAAIGKTTTTLLILYGKRETVKGLEEHGLIHRQPAGVKTSQLSLYAHKRRAA